MCVFPFVPPSPFFPPPTCVCVHVRSGEAVLDRLAQDMVAEAGNAAAQREKERWCWWWWWGGCFCSFAPLPVPPSSSQYALSFFSSFPLMYSPFLQFFPPPCFFYLHFAPDTHLAELPPSPASQSTYAVPSLFSIFVCWGWGVAHRVICFPCQF